MARRGLTESRAARLGAVIAVGAVTAQLAIGAAWSLTHDDLDELGLTRRCLEREKGLRTEPTVGDAIAASARGGTLRTIVEGVLVTVSVGTSTREVERLTEAYTAATSPGSRLDPHGRYVFLWLREPTPAQRQVTYDCVY